MENKLSPRVMAAAAAYVERHGEEKLLERLKLKGPVGRPPGSSHDNIDDSAALAKMAVEVVLGEQRPHAAAVEQGVWRAEVIPLLEQKQAMEAVGQLGPAYDALIAEICSYYVRQRRSETDWRRLHRKFRERRDRLYDQLQHEIAEARPVELNKKQVQFLAQ